MNEEMNQNKKSVFLQFIEKRVIVFSDTSKGTMRHQGKVKGVDERHLLLFDEISKTNKLILLDSINLCEELKV